MTDDKKLWIVYVKNLTKKVENSPKKYEIFLKIIWETCKLDFLVY